MYLSKQMIVMRIIFLASVGRQQKEYMGSFHAEKGNDQRRFSFL